MIRLYILILTLGVYSISEGQDTSFTKLRINEVTITATRTPMPQSQLAQSVYTIPSGRIQSMEAQTTADALAKTGMITVQKSQQGGGSPILRGMEANRILLVVDGVRMNNLIYRGGHVQNIITVDPNILERVDVLFGPASSVYGSDALGGVIHLQTKNPAFTNRNTFNSEFTTRYSTVNKEKMLHYDLRYGSQNLAALFSVSFSDYGDLNAGQTKNPYYLLNQGQRLYYYTTQNGNDVLVPNSFKTWVQTPTAYHQIDLTGKLKFKSGTSTNHLINLQYSTSSDIPRYDRLTDPDTRYLFSNAEWYYGPQKRLLASYSTEFKTPFPVKLNVNFQNIEESRYNRKVKISNLQNRIEKVNVLGFDLFHQQAIHKGLWISGMDAQYETVKSTAFLKNINTATTAPLDTRYPSGYNHMARLGVYSTLTHNLSSVLSLQESVRLGFASLSSDFGSNEFFKFPFQKINQSNLVYSANIGMNYKANELIHWGLVVASGFRVPNVDDLAKVFESGAGMLIVPNPNLKPEKNLTFELNYKQSYEDKLSYLNCSFYMSRLYDAIVTGPFKYNGQDSIFYNGRQSLVLANQNQRLARILGATIEGEGFFSKYMSVTFAGSGTLGNILKPAKSPLDHIPPASVKMGLVCHLDKARLEFNVHYNDWKRIKNYLLNAEDNEQYATPFGTPSSIIFNAYTAFDFTPHLKFGLCLENILDAQYRIFASGINAPGRNLSASLRLRF
jgi:hemoglobin/transferrin/lactoferrin receptor protein